MAAEVQELKGISLWENIISTIPPDTTNLTDRLKYAIAQFRLFKYQESFATLQSILDLAGGASEDNALLARTNRYLALCCESLGFFDRTSKYLEAAKTHQSLVDSNPRHPLDAAMQMVVSYQNIDEETFIAAHADIATNFVKTCRQYDDFDLVCYYMICCPQPVNNPDQERAQLGWLGYSVWHQDDRLALAVFGDKSTAEGVIHPIAQEVYNRRRSDPEMSLTWANVLAFTESIPTSEFIAFWEDPIHQKLWEPILTASYGILAARKRLEVHGDKQKFMDELNDVRKYVRNPRDGQELEDLIAQTQFEIDLSVGLGGVKVTWINQPPLAHDDPPTVESDVPSAP